MACFKMRKFQLIPLLALLVFSATPTVDAEDCFYCEKLERLRKGFAEVKPDSLNEKTIDQQNKLVDETKALAGEVIGAKAEPSTQDWNRVLGLLATAVAYDYENTMAGELLANMCPRVPKCARGEKFYLEITRGLKDSVLKTQQARDLRIAFGTAEQVREHGTEGDDSAE